MQWPKHAYEIVRRRWWNLNFNDDLHRTWQWLSSHEKASDSRAFYYLQSSLAVWKTSLEEKGNHGSFCPGGSEGSLSPVPTTGIQHRSHTKIYSDPNDAGVVLPTRDWHEEWPGMTRTRSTWSVTTTIGWSSVEGQGTGVRCLVTGLWQAARPTGDEIEESCNETL